SIDTNSSSVALPPCFLSILTSSKPPNEHLPYYNKSPRKMRGLCQQSEACTLPGAGFFANAACEKVSFLSHPQYSSGCESDDGEHVATANRRNHRVLEETDFGKKIPLLTSF
ncbi:MAG: hypothetical protein V1784_10565, partial [bacterium]